MEKIGAISKDRKNPVGFRYRGIEDALNHLQPALIELGLTVEIECRDLRTAHYVEKGEKKDRLQFQSHLLMDVSFIAMDGSRSKRTAAGEGLDTAGDKATNKAMAAAFKYAIFLGLCIPVEDGTLTDPDASGVKTSDPPAPSAPVIPMLPTQFSNLPPLPTENQLAALPPISQVAAPEGTGPKIADTVRDQIIALVTALDMPMDVVQAIIRKHGAEKLYDLSSAAGDTILVELKKLDLERQAAATFSKG